MKKSAVKLSIYVISALIGFSLILCIALYGVLACTSDSAACAEAPQNNTYLWAEGDFSQIVECDDGLHYEWDSNMPYPDVTVTSQYCLSVYGDVLYPSCTIIPNHTYCLRFNYYNVCNLSGTIVVRFPDLLNDRYMISLVPGSYSGTVFIVFEDYDTSISSVFSLTCQNPFGFSDLELIDITSLSYYYNSSYYSSSYPITDLQSFYFYFGTVYHPFAFDVDVSEAKYYGIEGAFDLGYDDGWDRGYNEGYYYGSNEGYTLGYNAGYADGSTTSYNNGYNDGFAEAVILTRAQSYDTSVNDFTYSSASYAYNARGILQPVDDGYQFLNIGWADMFPLSTFDALKKVRQFNASCVMNLYTYQESYNPNDGYSYTETSLFAGNVLFKTSYTEFSNNSQTIICNLAYDFLGSSPDNNVMLEFIIGEHSTSVYFVDRYIYGENVWPKTWFAVGATNSATDYVFTFEILPIDSSTSYELGYDAGVSYADSRVFTGSASYTAGRNSGLDTATQFSFYTLIDSVVLAPFKVLDTGLNFTLPVLNINIRDFLMSLFSIAILLAVVRFILGHS